ncbi:TonB family protein [Paraburkholderia sp. BR14261]
MARPHTHYDNLKVSRNAPPEVIRAAYKALSQRYHPDKNSSPDATRIMKILNEAYAVLSDEDSRRRYDATLTAEVEEPPRPTSDERQNKPPEQPPPEPERHSAQASTNANSEPADDRRSTVPPKKKRYGWLWSIGIAIAVLIRVGTKGSDHEPYSRSETTNYSSSNSVGDSSSQAVTPEAPVVYKAPLITSFDCKKARSPSEKLICSDEELAALDLNLATVFAQAKAVAPDIRVFAEAARQNWNWRNANCFDKTCLVTWFNAQRDRLVAILNEPVPAIAASQLPANDAGLSSTEGNAEYRSRSAPDTTGPRTDVSPSSLYLERVARRVRPNIVWSGETDGVEATINVRCNRDGTLLSASVSRSSGNVQWDEAALRAVQRSDPMPLDVNGEAPATFAITLRPSSNASSTSQNGRDTALSWAHAEAEQHANADAAYDLAKQKLDAISASCPDAKLLQQTPQKSGPYKPVIMFLSQQCGYIVSYWPESGEEQISFDRSMIASWSGYCSMRGGIQTTCTKAGEIE